MIEIKLFNGIENVSFTNGKHKNSILRKIDEILNINYGIRDISLLLSSISSESWIKILNNRTFNVIISYDYAMFYYNNGIKNMELEKTVLENFYSFNYFMENFFIGGFSLYENIAHILDDTYFADKVYKNEEDTKVSIYDEISRINKKIRKHKKIINGKIRHETNLLENSKGSKEVLDVYNNRKNDIVKMEFYIKRIKDIIESDKYKKVMDIRHDIVHNNPPLIQENTMIRKKDEDGVIKNRAKDMNTEKIKQYMDIFLEQYVEILTILKEMLEGDNYLKKI